MSFNLVKFPVNMSMNQCLILFSLLKLCLEMNNDLGDSTFVYLQFSLVVSGWSLTCLWFIKRLCSVLCVRVCRSGVRSLVSVQSCHGAGSTESL